MGTLGVNCEYGVDVSKDSSRFLRHVASGCCKNARCFQCSNGWCVDDNLQAVELLTRQPTDKASTSKALTLPAVCMWARHNVMFGKQLVQ